MSLQSSGAKNLARTSKHLYRDCLRLIQHVAGKSRKATQLKMIVGKEFRRNAAVKDVEATEALKSNAIRALANYLMMESASKDEKLRDRTAAYNSKEASSLK